MSIINLGTVDANGVYPVSPAPTAWSSTTAYVLNDAVSYNGTYWVAMGSSTNVTPGSNTALWQTSMLGLVETNDQALSAALTAATGASGVTAGSYTLTSLTVDSAGRITSASNGTGGGGGGSFGTDHIDVGDGSGGWVDSGWTVDHTDGRLANNWNGFSVEVDGTVKTPGVNLTLGGTTAVLSGSISGTATFDQTMIGDVKEVQVTAAALTGTVTSWTYPVAFTTTPTVINTISGVTVTGASTTAVTVTGTGGTGTIIIRGR